MPSFSPKGGSSRLAQLYAQNFNAPKAFDVENEGEEATIYVYDVIDDFFGIGSEEFTRTVEGISASVINVRLNSPGGDVFSAVAMRGALQRHPAEIVAHVDGLAASAATFLTAAADKVIMAKGARFMIHNSMTFQFGNKHDLRESAELLDGIDQDIADAYEARSNLSREEITDMMDAETWFTAEQAVDAGFADEIFSPKKPVENVYDLTAYDNAPEDFPKAEAAVEAPNEQVGESEVTNINVLIDYDALADKIAARIGSDDHVIGVLKANSPEELVAIRQALDRSPAPDAISTTSIPSGGIIPFDAITAGDGGKEAIIPLPESTEPVVRTMASRERRLRLLEREL